MNQSVPSIFSKNRSVSKAAVAEVGGAAHPRISIQNGRFTLVDAGGEKTPWNSFQLPVIIIGANPKKSKMYFDGPYDPVNPGPPTCWSDNGVAPSMNATKKMARTCAECELNAWGSETSFSGKQTKACSDKKKLAAIVVGDANELTYELQIPPASLKNLTLYAASVEKMTTPDGSRKADIADVVTVIHFKENAVGILEFSNIGWISCLDGSGGWHPNGAPDGGLAIAQRIDEIIESDVIDTLVGLKDQPWTGVHEGTLLPPGGGQPLLPRGSSADQEWHDNPRPSDAPPTGAFAGPFPTNGPATAPQAREAPPVKRGPGRPRKPETVLPAPKQALTGLTTSKPWDSAPASVSPAHGVSPMPAQAPGLQHAPAPTTSLADAINAAMRLPTR